MKAESSEKPGGKLSESTITLIALGLLLGYFLIRFMDLGALIALLVLGVLLATIISLSGYRAWILLIVVSLMSAIRYDWGQFTIRPDQVILLIMIIAWIPALLIGRAKLYRVPLLLPIALFMGVNFLSSALYSLDKTASYQGAALLSVYGIMYVMTYLVLLNYPEKMKSAVKVFLVLGSLQAVFALVSLVAQFGGIDLYGANPGHIESAISLQGGFEEPNLLGAFEAVMAAMFLALLISKNVGIQPRLLALGLILALLVLILTFTRAAWMGMVVSFAVLIFLQKPERNVFNPRALALAVVLAGALVLFSLSFASAIFSGAITERAGQILDFSGGSGGGRVDVQSAAIERWHQAKLLGTGTLSFPKGASEQTQGAWLFSAYIQALHDTGLVGLLLLVWFQLGLIAVLIRSYRITKDRFYRPVLAGMIAANLALFMASQASSFLWLGFPWIFFGLCMAVAHVSGNESGNYQ